MPTQFGTRTKLFVRSHDDFDTLLDIMCSRDNGKGERVILMHPEEVKYVEATASNAYDSLLRITREEAQQLIDELWQVGIRPTEGKGSAGALAAVEEHLKDERVNLGYSQTLVNRLMLMLENIASTAELHFTGASYGPQKEDPHQEKQRR